MSESAPVDPVAGLYAQLGEAALRGVVARFYALIPADELLGPFYPPHDLSGAEQRLADFLVFRCGGPQTYIEQRGHPRLRMRHVGFPITQALRDRWVELMTRAIEESALPPAPGAALQRFLAESATFLQNTPG